MKFTFTTKKVELSDSVKEYAEKKISKLDRYFKGEAEAFVTFSVEKNNRCVVEVTIRGGNTLFRAQEENKDGNMRAAIDDAQEYIDREVDASLSGGESKRIEIATVLNRKGAALLVFDEPEAGIDLWSFTNLISAFEGIKKNN